MIKQIKLFNHSHGLTDSRNGSCHTWGICGNRVRRYFALPKNCGRVFFTAYTQPGVDRVKVELKKGTFDEAIIHVDGKSQPNWVNTTQDALAKLLKKYGTFYVGCEYE